jgi:2EXR family protein
LLEERPDRHNHALAILLGMDFTSRRNLSTAKFELFPKLPAELRVAIWKAALPSGRLFEPYFENNPHPAYGGTQSNNNVTFTIGGAVGFNAANTLPPLVNLQGGIIGAQGAQHTVPRARADPPAVRFMTTFAPPKVRMACREAYRAAAEVGSFEFGIWRSPRRGHWFNYASDIVKISTVLLSHASFSTMDISKIQRLAFGQVQFKAEQNVVAVLDLIMATMPNCREVILFYEQDTRSIYPAGAIKPYMHPLEDGDIIGYHAFPAARNVGNDTITWGVLHRLVMTIWAEHTASQGYDPSRVPSFQGMDLIRGARRFHVEEEY